MFSLSLVGRCIYFTVQMADVNAQLCDATQFEGAFVKEWKVGMGDGGAVTSHQTECLL